MCFQGDGPHYRHTTIYPDNQVKPLKQWDKSKLPCFYILSCSHRSDKAYKPSRLLLHVVRIYRFYCRIVFHFINQQLCIYFLSDSSKEIASTANCRKQHWPECSGQGLQEVTLAFMCSIRSVIVLHKNVTTLIPGHETIFTSEYIDLELSISCAKVSEVLFLNYSWRRLSIISFYMSLNLGFPSLCCMWDW